MEKATKKAAAQATSDAATIATLEQQLADATKLSTLQAARLTAMQREQEVLQETERSMADALRNMDAKIDSLSDELHQARSKAKESEVEVQQHGEARRDREIESARQEQQLEAARAEIEELRAKVQQAKRDGLTRAAQLSARVRQPHHMSSHCVLTLPSPLSWRSRLPSVPRPKPLPRRALLVPMRPRQPSASSRAPCQHCART